MLPVASCAALCKLLESRERSSSPVISELSYRGFTGLAETEGFEPSIGLYNPITV